MGAPMTMPRLLAHINKRSFNKLTLRRDVSPVLIHTGRTSGRTYRTPLDATPVDGGYLFFVIYGRKSDWLKNVIANGSAELLIEGNMIRLDSPRLMPAAEARTLLPPGTPEPPGILKVTDYLRMSIAEAS